jgi:hypothetical protein
LIGHDLFRKPLRTFSVHAYDRAPSLLTLHAAALAVVETVAIVFRICDAIW